MFYFLEAVTIYLEVVLVILPYFCLGPHSAFQTVFKTESGLGWTLGLLYLKSDPTVHGVISPVYATYFSFHCAAK